MSKQRLSVVVTRRLPDVVETRLSELFDVKLREDDTPMTRSQLAEVMKTADILVPTVTDEIDASLISQAGDKLKLIANYGAGVDHIDVATARQRGVLVSNTPGVLTDDTADMTMALILAFSALPSPVTDFLIAAGAYSATLSPASPRTARITPLACASCRADRALAP